MSVYTFPTSHKKLVEVDFSETETKQGSSWAGFGGFGFLIFPQPPPSLGGLGSPETPLTYISDT